MPSVPTAEEPHLVASKTGSVLRRQLRLEPGNDGNNNSFAARVVPLTWS